MKKTIKVERKITRTIILNYDITKRGILCHSSETARFVWGSSIGITDLRHHLICLEGGKYIIPWKKLEERKQKLENKIARWKHSLFAIERIINKGKAEVK